MNIAVIGGLERNEVELTTLARRAGHVLHYHSGHVGGRGAEELRSLMDRVEVVVIITATTSHGSMYLAKRLARRGGHRTIVVRKLGRAAFLRLLEEVAAKNGSETRPAARTAPG
jgi:hypothetical protein